MGILAIPITKAKKNVSIDTDKLPEDVYAAALAEGLKALCNKNMSKITVKDLEGDDLVAAQEAAYAKGMENLQNLMEGNLKKRKSAGKESREVTTEARRLAREAVKAAFREAGKKISGIKASVITAAADELIAEDASYVEKARENVAKMKTRESVAAKQTGTLAALIADAETAKPKVAPTRKKKTEGASVDDVVAGAKTGKKGKAAQQAAH